MGEKLKEFNKHQIIHVPATVETSENVTDGPLPLGLTRKAVCMQVFIIKY